MDEQAVSQLFESIFGMSIADVKKVPDDAIQRICVSHQQRHEFEKALEDFTTIVLTTPLFGPGEDALRVDLLKIPQLIGGRQWHTAIHASDEEFVKARLAREDRPDLEILTLLRKTRRQLSQTEDARSFMLHGRSHPTSYSDSEHQQLFASIVAAMRKTTKSPNNE